MRPLGPLLAAALLAAGCATHDASKSAPLPSPPPTNTDPGAPAARLDQNLQGSVVFVNPQLRFVVMDFPLRRIPQPPQRLSVYRDGQKVGEVKVTGPTRDTTIAGDLTVGEARSGDEVRED